VRGAANLARVRALKARLDPDNVFRHTALSRVLTAAAAEP
jgi:FAD/FMN-containing dehydrogenase